ncbi:MAG: hypothetical protein DMG00_07850 [Acidobacteria bacterium]|nr:MAG: hypothetical protein DMG00_07850 [Acidobacteriota bacterium]
MRRLADLVSRRHAHRVRARRIRSFRRVEPLADVARRPAADTAHPISAGTNVGSLVVRRRTSHLLYARRSIGHRDISTGATRDFKSPVAARSLYAPAVSPDGAFVIFQVAGSGGWVLDARDGTTKFVLTDATVGDFAWSPDGRRVAYHSRRDDQWGIWRVAPAARDSRTNRFDS